MGSLSFAFPRELVVETSHDGSRWERVWSGETSVLTVRAALARPTEVPLSILLERASGRFLRLRQTAHATVPWWIAELAVYGMKN